MSSSTTGFIIGMFVGGLTVFVMMSVIITASRADEKERRLFEEYLRNRRSRFICIFSDLFGELPNCDGQCWGCRFAYEQREEERPTINEVREAFGFPPVEKEDEC